MIRAESNAMFEADALLSKIVCHGARCARCMDSGRGERGPIECAHIVGRAHHLLRHDITNVRPLCASCHRQIDQHDGCSWSDLVPEAELDRLHTLAAPGWKRPPTWFRDNRARLRQQARNLGVAA